MRANLWSFSFIRTTLTGKRESETGFYNSWHVWLFNVDELIFGLFCLLNGQCHYRQEIGQHEWYLAWWLAFVPDTCRRAELSIFNYSFWQVNSPLHLDKAIVTNPALWFLLAKHFWKFIAGIISLLKLKWHTFFPYMFHHSLYFRSDDSSLHYCFCISIALIGAFWGITVYMQLANAISSTMQLCPFPPTFPLSLSLLSLISPFNKTSPSVQVCTNRGCLCVQ